MIRLLSTYLEVLRTVKMILLLLLIRASTCLAWGDIEGHMLPKSDPRMEKMPSNSSSSTSAAALSKTHKTFLTDPSGYLAASRQEVTSPLSCWWNPFPNVFIYLEGGCLVECHPSTQTCRLTPCDQIMWWSGIIITSPGGHLSKLRYDPDTSSV